MTTRKCACCGQITVHWRCTDALQKEIDRLKNQELAPEVAVLSARQIVANDNSSATLERPGVEAAQVFDRSAHMREVWRARKGGM